MGFEAVAVVAGFQDVAVVAQPVEQRRGHLGIAERAGPLGEVEVGGDGDAGVFVELADEMEQQGTAGLRERQVAEFIEDDEVECREPGGEAARFAGDLFLFEGVDEFDGGEEPDAAMQAVMA